MGNWRWYQCSSYWRNKTRLGMEKDRLVAFRGWPTGKGHSVNLNWLLLITLCVEAWGWVWFRVTQGRMKDSILNQWAQEFCTSICAPKFYPIRKNNPQPPKLKNCHKNTFCLHKAYFQNIWEIYRHLCYIAGSKNLAQENDENYEQRISIENLCVQYHWILQKSRG